MTGEFDYIIESDLMTNETFVTRINDFMSWQMGRAIIHCCLVCYAECTALKKMTTTMMRITTVTKRKLRSVIIR